MRQITKNKEPQSLTEHRAKQFSDYDNYEDKDDVRESTHSEQRGICCYCLGAIRPNRAYMKIEHFECQEDHPDKQLVYSNMLAACKGNMGRPEKEQHCDTFKGRKDMTFYPCDTMRDIGALIKYGNDGTISSDNEQLNAELESVLNLNITKLKVARKGALNGFQDILKHKGKLQKATLNKWLADWEGTSHDNNLRPYCMVVAYWLRKKINRI